MPRSKQAKRDAMEPSTEPKESSSASGEEEPSKSEPENDSYMTNPNTSRAGLENSEDNANRENLRNKKVKAKAEGKGKTIEKEIEKQNKNATCCVFNLDCT
ncbi:hypothetical protein FN846DRAFT_888678 [Sphaerosporella brunnea]|uniref:Uncharacterized protein n=1 Tax=Sphaerosporella brunnea TaxID=1250544 RepID=A0A5J5F295_9PEZI|nr:hypothetical protein FN846DRAFT_888678 [Sphaerosporella brunnea]